MKPAVNEMVSTNAAAGPQGKLSTQSDNAPVKPQDARTAPITPSGGSLAQREQERLLRRRDHIGEIVRLTPERQDCLNPDSEFALDPHFDWIGWQNALHRTHYELRYFRYGTIADLNGELIPIKGYTPEFVRRIRDLLPRMAPLMAHFGLRLPAIYEYRSKHTSGSICWSEEYGGRTIPDTLVLNNDVSDGELVHTFIHELAHVGHLGVGHRMPWRLLFGELLQWYLDEDVRDWREAIELQHINLDYEDVNRSAVLPWQESRIRQNTWRR